jgi:hypothetical protein
LNLTRQNERMHRDNKRRTRLAHLVWQRWIKIILGASAALAYVVAFSN